MGGVDWGVDCSSVRLQVNRQYAFLLHMLFYFVSNGATDTNKRRKKREITKAKRSRKTDKKYELDRISLLVQREDFEQDE